jgi:hypothetical protein
MICQNCGAEYHPEFVRKLLGRIEKMGEDLDRKNLIINQLKKGLAGHLFDGESFSLREAIRSELITMGLKAIDERDQALKKIEELEAERKTLAGWVMEAREQFKHYIQDARLHPPECDCGQCWRNRFMERTSILSEEEEEGYDANLD